MKQQPARSNASLSSLRIPILLSLFTATGLLGLLAVMAGALFPDYWKASSDTGWHVFSQARWWLDTALLLVFGVPGYFCLKGADRCAGELLNRFGPR